MLTVDEGRDIVAKVRDQVADGGPDAVNDVIREHGIDPEVLDGLRTIAGLTFGTPGVALVDAAMLGGVALGKAAAERVEA